MEKYEGASFRADAAWQGFNLGQFSNAVVKLRWADQPFRWHENRGEEIFVVLAGEVDMHVREPSSGDVKVIGLSTGDLLHLNKGEEHVAHPRGEARILVIEEDGN